MTDEQNVLSYYIIHKTELSQVKRFMFMLQKQCSIYTCF
jgi:hypothetical protein